MNHLKYYKIFESQDDDEDNEYSIQSFFSQSKEEIEDLFINLIDHNFEIDIRSEISNKNFEIFRSKTLDDFNNKFYYGSKEILEYIVNGEAFNCFTIQIGVPEQVDMTSKDLFRWAFLFSELKRISSKCKYFNCSIDSPSDWPPTGKTKVVVRILSEPNKDKVKLRSFLNKILDDEIIHNKYNYLSKIILSCMTKLTPAIKIIQYPSKIDNKIYLIFKPVPKQVLNLNLERLQSLVGSRNIKSIKLADAEELLKGVLKEEVLDFQRPVIIIEAELDISKIEKSSLQSNNIEFLKNLIKKIS